VQRTSDTSAEASCSARAGGPGNDGGFDGDRWITGHSGDVSSADRR
jgi:hypothetical protein